MGSVLGRLAAAVACLVSGLVLADTLWKNQGGTLGPVNIINCSGSGITCTRVGAQGNITFAGDGGYGSPVTSCDAGPIYHQAVLVSPSGDCTGMPGCVPACGACSPGSFLTAVAGGGVTCGTPPGTGVTSVGGTNGVSSSGGTTPTISGICAAAATTGLECVAADGKGSYDAGFNITVNDSTHAAAGTITLNNQNATGLAAYILGAVGGTFAGFYSFGSTYSTASLQSFTTIFSNQTGGIGMVSNNSASSGFHWKVLHTTPPQYDDLINLEYGGTLRSFLPDAGVAFTQRSLTSHCLGDADTACMSTNDANMLSTLKWSIGSGGTNSSSTPTAGEVAYGDGSKYAFTSGGTSGYLLQSNGTSPPTWAARPTSSFTWSSYCDKSTCTKGSDTATNDYFLMPMFGIDGTGGYMACNYGVTGGAGDLVIDVYDITGSTPACTMTYAGECDLAVYRLTTPQSAAGCNFSHSHRYVTRINSSSTCGTLPGHIGCVVQISQP